MVLFFDWFVNAGYKKIRLEGRIVMIALF